MKGEKNGNDELSKFRLFVSGWDGMGRMTYDDADTADRKRTGERAPVLPPHFTVVPRPRLWFVLVHFDHEIDEH